MACTSRRAFSILRHLAKHHFSMNSPSLPDIFLPPINHAMRELDRSFFQKTIPTSCATIFQTKDIFPVRKALEKTGECLNFAWMKSVIDDPDVPGSKRILLYPTVKAEDPNTWSTALQDLAKNEIIKLKPYELNLTYDNWTMHNILEAILPDLPPEEKETPAGFSVIGHVAHMNLRKAYLPSKYLIGQILLDKNPQVTTVINKLEDVGTESVYRTFPYEVLAGPDDLDVTTKESDCEFQFNFGKVYWNPRLQGEHLRILDKFSPGEALCDVMAGVGPFSVPAAKRHTFVYANDLNPDSFQGLQWAAKRNKVTDFIAPSCMDGRAFIREATEVLASQNRVVKVPQKPVRQRALSPGKRGGIPSPKAKTFIQPKSFDHYVMNLPKTAVEFLDAFWGLYQGREAEFDSTARRKLPMIHVYLFARRDGTALSQTAEEEMEVCETVSQHLGYTITPQTLDVELWYVRLVSPNKKMYCASFRLPPEVAFAVEDRPVEVLEEHSYSQIP